jgi:hypothetical protein
VTDISYLCPLEAFVFQAVTRVRSLSFCFPFFHFRFAKAGQGRPFRLFPASLFSIKPDAMANNKTIRYKHGKTEIQAPHDAESLRMIRREQWIRVLRWVAGVAGMGALGREVIGDVMRWLTG